MQLKRIITSFFLAFLLAGMLLDQSSAVAAEGLYFPVDDSQWEFIDPSSVGWDPRQLDAALAVAGARQSSGVVILYQGKILAERYWDSPDDSTRYRNMVTGTDVAGRAIEDVASAQKSVVAVLTGIAQERGFLQLDDPVSKYTGIGWSQASPEQEAKITIRHLLSMNSGLGTDFSFVGPPETVWLYNTPVYHELMRVLIAATGIDRQSLTRQWITEPLGMSHSSWTDRPWANSDIAVGLSTTARDLARFGLMLQANGNWSGETVIADGDYLDSMLSPAQRLNPAYGYLWWLNGQEFGLGTSAVAPRRDGPLVASAPADMVAMLGALDRKLYLVPSLNLVITRLGSNGAADGVSFNDAFWEALMKAAPER